MDARLKILTGPLSGRTISIPRGKLLIGREEDCHLRFASEFVSRHHCVLLLDESRARRRGNSARQENLQRSPTTTGGTSLFL